MQLADKMEYKAKPAPNVTFALVFLGLGIKHNSFTAECFRNNCSYGTAHQNGYTKGHGKMKYG